jgi:hypothetical protein
MFKDIEQLKIERRRVADYVSTTNATRAEKGLPDPFSNMSFSGVDIQATMVLPMMMNDSGQLESDFIELGELQTISYSIHRENSPVRTLGHVNPRGFVKGSRTIAGSLIFTVFNEYAFYRIKQFKQALLNKNYAPVADMLPPFDVVLTFFNEYGLAAKMKLYGITIVDEGQTMSIDDLITEQTYTYMARGIQPMVHLDPAEDRNIYANLPDEQSRYEDWATSTAEGISTNFFGDNVAAYKNFINARMNRS